MSDGVKHHPWSVAPTDADASARGLSPSRLRATNPGMPIPINAPPESLAHDLTMSLGRERTTLRLLARRRAWEPSIDDCRDLAGRMVEYLKTRGVLRVIREGGAENHSISPIVPKSAAPPMPLWVARSPRGR
jgi:hypothetical protein